MKLIFARLALGLHELLAVIPVLFAAQPGPVVGLVALRPAARKGGAPAGRTSPRARVAPAF
eukprot:8358749-Pyramimonas_sp.AAC.1